MKGASVRIDGEVFVNAAMAQAFVAGATAKLEGEPLSANPYAVEMEFGGTLYCPTEEQRDEWARGYASIK